MAVTFLLWELLRESVLFCLIFNGVPFDGEQQGVCYAFVEFEDSTAAQSAIEVKIYHGSLYTLTLRSWLLFSRGVDTCLTSSSFT